MSDVEARPTGSQILQTFVFPTSLDTVASVADSDQRGSASAEAMSLQLATPPSATHDAERTRLYVHAASPSVCVQSGVLRLPAHGTIDLCSLFNAFSHRKWHDLTGLQHLGLVLHGTGDVTISVSTYTAQGERSEAISSTTTLKPMGITVSLPPLSSLAGEILGVEIRACGSVAELTSAAWTTEESPRRKIRLAAVVTTFQREAAAQSAMKTFSETTCARPPLGEVKLLVVDNGRSLPPCAIEHVQVFANPNLGGAGGFSRGLIEAIDAGVFTHILFMDDDAACEPESVWRTMTLLAYAIDDGLSVAGAMMFSDNPCLQYEKGALLETTGETGYIWKSQQHMIDLGQVAAVCSNEPTEEINYGGWWFFAFPLSRVKHMPFPFFVRGDDVDFSLSNKLRVVTLNGIATWCDPWSAKAKPATEYLAWRAWMALALMHGSDKSIFLVLWNSLAVARGYAAAGDYRMMSAVLNGLEDALRGPETFLADPAPITKIKAFNAPRTAADALSRPKAWLRVNWVLWRHRFVLRSARARYQAPNALARTRSYWEPLFGTRDAADPTTPAIPPVPPTR